MGVEKMNRPLLGVVGIVMAAGLGACSSDKVNSVTSVATALTANAGVSGQTGTVGQALTTPISVHVADQNGAAMAGVVITWQVTGSGGSVDSATSTTNSNGDAVTDWTLGTTTGADSLSATTSTGLKLAIGATANAGTFTTLAKVSGDSQSVASGSAGQPLVVKALDQFGNAVPGVTINWAATGGGTLSVSAIATDANGLAQVVLTTGATPGSYTITASSGTVTPIMFQMTGT
jgi:hypothetical protein